MRYTPLIIVFLFLTLKNASAQYYNTGQDPASIKWLRIRTEKFDVIYPETYGKTGIEFARTLDQSYSQLKSLFTEGKARLPVVIHNFSTRSNGYVAWAPKRMEIYPAPDQNTIPGDQHRLLSIHELTHVMEMESLNTGFSRVMSYLAGEQFTGVAAALLPLWYLEGNAVVSETMLSSSGRGRTPSFLREMKAITVEKGKYKYDKIINGSYRDYVPDHYQSGYQMTAWAMAAYDRDIWNKVLRFTGEQPFTLNPVNISLRKNAGLTKKRLYNETFDTLSALWARKLSGGNETFEILNPPKHKEYINYYSPIVAGVDSIIAIKTALSSSPFFVLIAAGKEKIIHVPGNMYPWQLSYGAGKILWIESRPDPRWENRNYAVIRCMDLKKGKVKTLAKKSRYLSASISPDGKQVVAVENTADNLNNLVILDAETGVILRSVQSPDNLDIQRPQWSADGTRITVLFLTAEGEGIKVFTAGDSSWETFVNDRPADLQSSFLRNDSLFFISAVSGIDNIWLRTPAGELKQLTDSRFGTRDLYAVGNKIIFSDYTAEGNNICVKPLHAASFQSEIANPQSEFIVDRIDKPEIKTEISDQREFTPEPYRKWSHLFRFHSWMPFYADIEKIRSDPQSIRPGLTLMSQNALSTMESTLSYEYSSDRRHVFHSGITWYGWYPVINARMDYGYQPAVIGAPVNSVQPGFRFSGNIFFPIIFSTGYFTQYLRPGFDAEYANNVYPAGRNSLDYGQTSITWRFYFSNISKYALRDIYPRWAQTADINRVTAPFDKELLGSSTFLKTSFYFPGLLKDHGVRIRLEKERQNQSKLLFSNRIFFPRGYRYLNMVSKDLNVLTADYVFPVFYPDLNLSSILYIKRVRSGLFFDNAWAKGNRYYNPGPGGTIETEYIDATETFRSYGVELLADFHLFRIPFMISGGAQAAWRSGEQSPYISAIFNLDLYGFSIGSLFR